MLTNVLLPIHQYRNIGTATAVGQADPHRLILLLFDGAIASLLQARHALAVGDGDTRRATISKAMRIIDEGLKAALEPRGNVQLAANLGALYEHMVSRLFQANLRADDEPLAEVAGLLGGLRATWAEIAPAPPTLAGQVQA
jgi:flagellar secretion chaperone FliS